MFQSLGRPQESKLSKLSSLYYIDGILLMGLANTLHARSVRVLYPSLQTKRIHEKLNGLLFP